MPFFCSPQHTLAGTSARGKFPMEGDRISQVRAELTRLFDEQVEFFRRRAQQQPSPAEQREYKERQERVRQLFGELRGLREVAEAEARWSPQIARFVRMMRLCEARPRFSNRISCCISLPGPAESFCPSQGCALTGWPCSQRHNQLGRQKSAVRQPSQKQSN